MKSSDITGVEDEADLMSHFVWVKSHEKNEPHCLFRPLGEKWKWRKENFFSKKEKVYQWTENELLRDGDAWYERELEGNDDDDGVAVALMEMKSKSSS